MGIKHYCLRRFGIKTGPAMFEFAKSVLRGDDIPEDVIESHLVLILKEERPISIKS